MVVVSLWLGAFLHSSGTRTEAFSARLHRPWEGDRRKLAVVQTKSERGRWGPSLPSLFVLRRRRDRMNTEDVLVVMVLAASAQSELSMEEEGGSDAEVVGIEPSRREIENKNNLHHHHDHYPFDGTLSPPTKDDHPDAAPTVWKDRAALFKMTRPSSIPGIVLFHMLGVFLVLRGTTMGGATNIPFWSFLLKEPTLWLTLLSTNLVSATSMVVNDYYDAKLGRDALKLNAKHKLLVMDSNDKESSTSVLSRATAKRFLMYLYAGALVVSTCLPGVPTRLSVVVALMMTYLYTKHLKPLTWVKNAVCASLIALAPWTSGSCAWNLLQQHQQYVAAGAATGSSSSSAAIGSLRFVFLVPELWRLFAVLFAGVLGRELLMDIVDVVPDEAAGIRTVPVVHGRLYAVKVAALSTGIMAIVAMAPHVQQLWRLPAAIPIWTSPPLRRLLLAGVASAAHLRNIWKVWKSRGEDAALITKTVDASLLTVVGLLASFV